MMRILLAMAVVGFGCAPAIAGPHCTDVPEGNWLSKAQMMDRIKPMGYQVDILKKTKGNCYEIYGRDKSGKRIEIYFHPVTGEAVKSSGL